MMCDQIHHHGDCSDYHQYHLGPVWVFTAGGIMPTGVVDSSSAVTHDATHLPVDSVVVPVVRVGDKKPNDHPESASTDSEDQVQYVIGLLFLIRKEKELVIHGCVPGGIGQGVKSV